MDELTSDEEQYSTDANLAARQRLWVHQDPPFDLAGWVAGLLDVPAGGRILDVGCGNGAYLNRLRSSGADVVVGCDLSLGMLGAAPGPGLIHADAAALPVRSGSFDVVLAAHMLYHVGDQEAAAAEMNRALVPGGRCVAVTNGEAHIAALRRLVESVVHEWNPEWRMTDWATRRFSLENGGPVLRDHFAGVTVARPAGPSRVVVRDADVIADYVGSVAGLYQPEVGRSWAEVVERCRRAARLIIERDGEFVTAGDVGAFICEKGSPPGS